MKKLFLTLLFNILFAQFTFAQSISSANYDNNIAGGIKSMDKCWECKLVEGVYTYTFNFVYKIYNVLSPIVYTLVLVFLAFWFLWFVWEKVIKAHINFKGENVFDFLKEIWIKIFTILFVLTLLTRVPANKIFSYTIDPIMSFGAGFGKWILVETRNENELMQNYTSTIRKKALPKYDCNNIKLSENTINMLKVNNVDTNDEDGKNMNMDTIKNLICITGEYANSYTIGLNLGAKILSRGLIGMAESYGAKKVDDWLFTLSSFIPSEWGFVAKIILIFVKIFIWMEIFFNIFIIYIGLLITIQFLYVGLTFITMILDIVIQLALVGVMMPIVIGAWAFHGKNDMVDLRGKLSGKLFWNVLRCSIRLAFLAISVSISIFLLNELMTTTFNINSKETMLSLYDSFEGSSIKLMRLLTSNIGLIVAMIFTTFVSWMLLSESIQKADSFSDSLYRGISNNKILQGLKNLTINSIKYITSGPKVDFDLYRTRKAAKEKIRNESEANDDTSARRSQIQNWENEIFNEGDDTHIFDVPAEDIVNEFERIRNDERDDVESVFGPQDKPVSDPNNFPNSPIAPNLRENKQEIEDLQSSETEFISDKLASPEYKNLPEDKKEKLAEAIISNDKQEVIEASQDADIAQMFETKNATPMEDDEIEEDKDITQNLVATEVLSTEDLSNPVIKLQSVYIREQILEEIKNLPSEEKKLMKKFMNLKKKPNLSIPEKKKEYDKQKQIYERLESKVRADFRIKSEKLKNLIEERNNLQSYNKKKTVLTTKNVILVVKNDEIQSLQKEMDSTDFTDVAKRSYLRRKLKKLEDEISSINEKNSLELEDEYDDIIVEWKRNKRKRGSKINKAKKI